MRLRLRRWQKSALDCFTNDPRPDRLLVATPGAGKTMVATAWTALQLAERPDRHAVVVAPTRHLKQQWARTAAALGLQLDPDWDGRSRLARDLHGVVVTYAQAASSPDALAAVAAGGPAVIDEIHHAATDRSWGDGLVTALSPAAVRLSLSGTPFRSDANPIPFVAYDRDGVASPDFVYGYGEALADRRVVRPIVFPRIGGSFEWIDHEGASRSATFEDPIDREGGSQRLRTALAPDGEWLTAALRAAHERLVAVRREDPAAGGLVITMDVAHARAVAGALSALTGTTPAIAVSEDPRASQVIRDFAQDRRPWIVAVRLISEGVDLPRLRVGVYATNIVTELFFRQAVGRLVRWRADLPAAGQCAWMYLPDDPRLRAHAALIRKERTHALPPPSDPSDRPVRDAPFADPEQMSLFQAVSSTATAVLDDEGDFTGWDHLSEGADPDDVDFVLPVPTRGGAEAGGAPVAERRGALRGLNHERVLTLVRLTGRSHQDVNAQLNRLARVESVRTATAADLRRRLDAADAWLDQLTRRA